MFMEKTKVLSADLIWCELFYLAQIENQASTEFVKILAEEVAKIWKYELNNKKTFYQLSSIKGKWDWG